MGLRSGAFLCQRVTNAVRYIANRKGLQVVNYLDDFAGAESWELADQAFEELGSLLRECGLEESPNKACRPSCRMLFLGILCDTESLTLEVSQERIKELRELLGEWQDKGFASRKEVERLVGVLQFVSACVRPGRIFMARILNMLRGMPEVGRVEVEEELRQDIKWWQAFIEQYNGISMIPEAEWSEPDALVACDACLEGAGGFYEGRYFHCRFPQFIVDQSIHINGLELLTIIVAFKVWGRLLTRKKVLMLCDNLSSVVVSQTGRAKDRVLQACLRELVYTQARWGFEVRIQHVRGEENRIPDLLSRWELGPKYREEFFARTVGQRLQETYIYEGSFHFSHDW